GKKRTVMKIIYREANSGKTLELIKLSAETRTYIICLNRKRVDEIVRIANKNNIYIPFPLTLEEFLGHRFYGTRIESVLIDNADEIIRALFRPLNVEAITMTKEG
ncbi:MAG: hypothetical protein J6A05_01775, partial [Oscillospiraceae bacterium]|nr:hypothetical protein [Oscillospiraceae bacterium]